MLADADPSMTLQPRRLLELSLREAGEEPVGFAITQGVHSQPAKGVGIPPLPTLRLSWDSVARRRRGRIGSGPGAGA
jgi:hypothetical protein